MLSRWLLSPYQESTDAFINKITNRDLMSGNHHLKIHRKLYWLAIKHRLSM